MPPCRAMFSSKEDDLQVQVVPVFLRKDSLEVALGSLDVGSVGKTPSSGKPVDVGVDREGRDAKGLSHDHPCGLVADTRKGFQRFEGVGDVAIVVLQEHLRKSLDVLGLRGCKTNVADEGLDDVHVQGGHGRWGWPCFKQRWRDLVDLQVRGLGGHQDRDEEFEGIPVVQRNRCLWIHLIEH